MDVDIGEHGRFYADHDPWQPFICDCLGISVWTYEESNGIDGLQRDDEVHSDVWDGCIEPDTLIW